MQKSMAHNLDIQRWSREKAFDGVMAAQAVASYEANVIIASSTATLL